LSAPCSIAAIKLASSEVREHRNTDRNLIGTVISKAVFRFPEQPASHPMPYSYPVPVQSLVEAFRAAEHPVLWVRQEFEPDLSDAFREMRHKNLRITIKDTPGCQIVPELIPDPNEPHIRCVDWIPVGVALAGLFVIGAITTYAQIDTRSQYGGATAAVVDDKGNLRVPADYRTTYHRLSDHLSDAGQLRSG
jgi:hypothetical protein